MKTETRKFYCGDFYFWLFGDIFTPLCYKFIQVTACRYWLSYCKNNEGTIFNAPQCVTTYEIKRCSRSDSVIVEEKAYYVPQQSPLLVNLMPHMYSATPRSTAHQGFVSISVFAQRGHWVMSVALKPSLAYLANRTPFVVLMYDVRLRATFTSRRPLTDTARHIATWSV